MLTVYVCISQQSSIYINYTTSTVNIHLPLDVNASAKIITASKIFLSGYEWQFKNTPDNLQLLFNNNYTSTPVSYDFGSILPAAKKIVTHLAEIEDLPLSTSNIYDVCKYIGAVTLTKKEAMTYNDWPSN